MNSFSTTFYFIFIQMLILMKIVYAICIFWMFYLRFKKEKEEPIYSKLEFWKERSELIFIIGVSVLLIHYFNPFSKKPIILTKEEKFAIFTFGWVILLTVNWEVFVKESEIFTLFHKAVSIFSF